MSEAIYRIEHEALRVGPFAFKGKSKSFEGVMDASDDLYDFFRGWRDERWYARANPDCLGVGFQALLGSRDAKPPEDWSLRAGVLDLEVLSTWISRTAGFGEELLAHGFVVGEYIADRDGVFYSEFCDQVAFDRERADYNGSQPLAVVL